MSVAVVPSGGRPMTWAEYEALDDPRLEYVDGRAVMAPTGTLQHQTALRRLANALEPVLPPSLGVVEQWSWKPAADEFVPDVMVFPADTRDEVRFTGIPALVVEVLSTNRSNDLVLKVGKYAALGVEHYWVLDPRDEVLDAYVLRSGLYAQDAHVRRGEVVRVSFGAASLAVDLDALLR